MLDPLTSLSLACNILQILEQGAKAVKKSKEIFATGSTEDDAHLDSLLRSFSQLTVKFPSPAPNANSDEKEFFNVVQKCVKLTNELQDIIQADRPKDPKSKRQAVVATFKTVVHNSAKKNLKEKLDDLHKLLELYLVFLNRVESTRRLDEIVDTLNIKVRQVEQLQSQISFLGETQDQLASSLQSGVASLTHRSQQIYDSILQLQVLNILCPAGIDERFIEVSKAHEKTLNWILEPNNDYQAKFPDQIPLDRWLASGSGIFHIAGKLGSGKSTLMKFLWGNRRTVSYLRQWAGDKQLVLSKFFFWRHGNNFQRSINGLYRTILYDVLSSHPELLTVALSVLFQDFVNDECSLYDLRSKFYSDAYAARDTLRCIFKSKDLDNKYRFCIFIDGLDEFEETENMDYKDLVQDIKEWIKISKNVKICLSSREYNSFNQSFDKTQRIRLQDLNNNDISIFVTDRLGDSESLSRDGVQEIVELILQKAEGVFLWVAIVVRILRKGIENNNSVLQLRSKVNSVPRKLKDLFAYLLDSIDEDDRCRAYSIFAVAMSIQKEIDADPTSTRRFYLLEYVFLEEMLDKPGFLISIPPKYSPLDKAEYNRRAEAAARRLNGLCYSLLEVIQTTGEPSHIAFTHRSVYEFLFESHSTIVEKYTQNFPLHSTLWKIYFAYLASEPTQNYFSNHAKLNLAIEVGFAIQNIMNDNSLEGSEQVLWMDWLDTVIWAVQKMGESCLGQSNFSAVLRIPGSASAETDVDIVSGKSFIYLNFVVSIFHLAAALGWQEYIFQKMDMHDKPSTALRKYRLYRAIRVALEFGNPRAISMLGKLLESFNPNEVLVISGGRNQDSYWRANFRSTAWLDFLSRLIYLQAWLGSLEKPTSRIHPTGVTHHVVMSKKDIMEEALEIFLEHGANCRISIALHPVVYLQLGRKRYFYSRSIINTTDNHNNWEISLLDEQDLRILATAITTDRLLEPKPCSLEEYLNSQSRLVSLKDFMKGFLKPRNLEKIMKLIDGNLSSTSERIPEERIPEERMPEE